MINPFKHPIDLDGMFKDAHRQLFPDLKNGHNVGSTNSVRRMEAKMSPTMWNDKEEFNSPSSKAALGGAEKKYPVRASWSDKKNNMVSGSVQKIEIN